MQCSLTRSITQRDGIVYCLVHPSWPHLVKIGLTHRSVMQRLKELNTEALPGAYSCYAAIRVPCAAFCEQMLHTHLAPYRQTHEFFDVPPQMVKSIFGMLVTLLGGCETNEHDNAAYPRITVARDAEPPKDHTYSESNRSNAWFKVDEEAVKKMFLDGVDIDVIADTTGRSVRAIA